MNKKITVRNNFDKTVYCVLSGEADFDEQLSEVFSFQKGQGFSAHMSETAVIVTDYFHGEERARFDIISIEDTDQAVQLYWREV